MTLSPKPHYYLLMIQVSGLLGWCELENDEYLNISHRPAQYRIYQINGQKARVFVCCEDNELGRVEALKCASEFMYGRGIMTHVNLDTLEVTYTKCEPKTRPPY